MFRHFSKLASVVFVMIASGPAVGRDRDSDSRPLYKNVERELDRGTGRIEDRETYELRQLREDRPSQTPGGKHDTERLQEDYVRQLRIDAKDRRAQTAAREAASPSKQPPARTLAEPTPGPFGSNLALHVAAEEKLLEAARVKYQEDLHRAEVQRDEDDPRREDRERKLRRPPGNLPTAELS